MKLPLKKEIMIEFGKRVRHVRKLLKLKQKEFAKRIGMANNYLSEIESGKVKPGFEFFYKTSKAFNINTFYLLHGGEPVFRPEHEPSVSDTVNRLKLQAWKLVENDDRVLELINNMNESSMVYHAVLEHFFRYIVEYSNLIKKDKSRSKAHLEKKD